MNIFVLDRDAGKAARYHCDKHVVKMLLETAQLLSTALWLVDPPQAQRLYARGRIYRATHRHHPCVRWLAESPANVRWLSRLGTALATEYQYRYGRRHASAPVIACLAQLAAQSRGGRRTPFAQAMPEQYRRADAVEAYRAYYRGAKAPIADWTRRRAPRWFIRCAEPAGGSLTAVR